MKKVLLLLLAAGAVAVFALVRGPAPQASQASSHREAPLISDDPTADNTDLYAFRSPDKPDTVTIISNWIPGEDPAAGPNYYTFSPGARYYIYVDKNGDAQPDITYRFEFKRAAGQFFLGNTQQDFTVTRIAGGQSQVVATGTTPPDNIGPKSTPNYRRSEEHTSELQSQSNLVCRLLLEKKNKYAMYRRQCQAAQQRS